MNKMIIALVAVVASGAVLGAENFNAAEHLAKNSNDWTAAIRYAAYFFAMAMAAVGGTKAQSAAASVALEGMARNPAAADKLFVPMILGLALMESLVIFTLITIFLV